MKATYTKQELIEAIKSVGIKNGDVLFCHSNVGYLGMPEGAKNKDEALQIILDAILSVIGDQGTLAVPTFTYSFSSGEIYNPISSPSNCGMFAEYVRCLQSSIRSNDPSISVACIGSLALDLTQDLPENAYDESAFFGRFFDKNGKILNINFDAGSTFLHFVERELSVPYRFDKTFVGKKYAGDNIVEAKSVIWVRDMDIKGSEANFERFNSVAVSQGYYKKQKIGRGTIGSITSSDAYSLLEKEIKKNVWFLTNKV
ncbi:AAC(3) family N-acetyltransferase [Salinivibrio kushneri]|uniref:Aminoglycoside N(3)-acetyltransferase n=1 Tax=Salinivibrio kushneri TaxID=1908198 RepID=A0AA47KJD7_9GAMM|nr:AAC(3) family N-acetyltransferase [Salinivibrio kushneri]WBA07883.1 AAC(3) family N-acetyltransferase [Salinivibrio kushneri]